MADETIEIGVKVNGEKSLKDLKKEVDATGKSTQNLNKEMKGLDSTFEDVYGDLKPMSSRLGEIEDRMYELANANKSGSKEFKILQAEAIKFRKTIRSVDQQVDSAAEGGAKLNNALAISSSVVASYTGLASLTALVGDEQEELMETMVKLQAAEGALQSIQQISYTLQQNRVAITNALTSTQTAYNLVVGKGTKAMKSFRLALVATGLGALIVTLGLLVENWDKVSEAIGGATATQRNYQQVQEKSLEYNQEELFELSKLKGMIDSNKFSREDLNGEIKDIQSEYPNLLKNLDAESATIENINIAINENIRLVKLQAKTKAAQALAQEKYTELLKLENEISKINNKSLAENTIQQTLFGRSNASVKATLENKRRELQGEIEDLIGLSMVMEKATKDEEENTQVVKENVKKVNKKVEAYTDLIDLYDKEVERIKNLIDLRKEWRDDAPEEVEIDGELDLTTEQDPVLDPEFTYKKTLLENIFNLEKGYDELSLQYYKLNAEEKEKIDREAAKNRLSLAAGVFDSLGNLATSLATDNEKSQKRAFNINKAASIATAAIQTYQSAQGAYASQLTIPSPDAPIRAKIAAGIAVATGLANIAKISSQKFEGGGVSGGSGGGGGSISRPTLGGSAQRASEQDVNVTNMFGSPNMGSEGTSDQFNSVERPQAQKVYVLQSEIAEANGVIASVEENSTL